MGTGATATLKEALSHGTRLLHADAELAALQAREILAADPGNADAYRLLGAALRRSGDDDEAQAAELQAISASVRDPVLQAIAQALLANDLPTAERALRPRLREKPTDVAAIRMMAELAARLGRFGDSENLLRRCLELAPGFAAAQANLATVLYRQNRPAEAIAELDRLQSANPDRVGHEGLRAASLGRIGSYDEAVQLYKQLLDRQPDQAKLWISYGHALKTIGRRNECIAAYRRAADLLPSLGETWWSLANLKTFAFSAADVTAMRTALDSPQLTQEDSLHLHFALGKALEDEAEYEASFLHYREGNRLRRSMIDYDFDEISTHVARCRSFFTAELMERRGGDGYPVADPIFILGMPRAGSTLVEQILASHPQVEGTMELPDIAALARRLGGRKLRSDPTAYPEILDSLQPTDLAALGREYIERTRIQRKTDRPFFIDKMPNNWAHVGAIALILPNARIIDARRHPLACCFSNFKQHFAIGQGWSYDQTEIGQYYREYVTLMAHFDEVSPGRVYRLLHERLVDEPEAEVGRLLDWLGLPFDSACLRFHENNRAVRTASSEQVRRPINREGLDQWRAYEQWLGPLKAALGSALE